MNNGYQYVVMPITTNDCLVVVPEIRIVPHYINADAALSRDISNILIANARDEFLAGTSFQYSSHTREEPNQIMRRIILSIAKITADK